MQLDDKSRLDRFTDRLVSIDDDPVLQRQVRQAVSVTGAPVALVSLVLGKIQHFRAHIGLPKELEIAAGSSRCDSFCQFVVQREEPLCIEDAAADPALPQGLVQRYGIRAYLGHPITVDGLVLGSLCVIDTQPRSFSTAERSVLEELARRVERRLAELAELDDRARLDDPEARSAAEARSLAEIAPLTRVAKARQRGALNDREAASVLAVLDEPFEFLTQRAGHTAHSLLERFQEHFGDASPFLMSRFRLRTGIDPERIDPDNTSRELAERVRGALSGLVRDSEAPPSA
jgi:GAF domain-containing protein